MIKVASLPIAVDLKPFSTFLYQQGLDHRINEESGQLVIWAHTDAEAEIIRQALQHWSQDPASLSSSGNDLQGRGLDPGQLTVKLFAALSASPITWLLILLSAAVAVTTRLGQRLGPVREWFYPLLPTDGLVNLLGAIDSGAEVWRTLAPMFLHFGELHLVFNMLWLWYFGKQLEALQPTLLFAALVLITAFVSNTTQYLAIGYNNFGGMSGVVYGLVGYTWVMHYFLPRSGLLINRNMFVFFVVALVVMEIVASSWIATAAHVSGLLSGLVLGLLIAAYYRLVLGRHSLRK